MENVCWVKILCCILPMYALDLEDLVNTYFGVKDGDLKVLVSRWKEKVTSNWRIFMPEHVSLKLIELVLSL